MSKIKYLKYVDGTNDDNFSAEAQAEVRAIWVEYELGNGDFHFPDVDDEDYAERFPTFVAEFVELLKDEGYEDPHFGSVAITWDW